MSDYKEAADFPYFIYRHLKADTGEPFYIGMGKCILKYNTDHMTYYRAHSDKGRTKLWFRIVKKHGLLIEILQDRLTLQEACDKEKEFINLYGISKNGGLLCNFKEGGVSGATLYKHSKETIERFSSKKRLTIEQSIEKYVYPEPNTGCWLWAGQISENHPKLNYRSRTLEARRAIYEHFNYLKLVAKKEVTVPNCGCYLCVNPLHVSIKRINQWAKK